MSEFSETYHLESSDLQEGIELLRKANLRGLVFPARDGWVSFFPESKFGEDLEELKAANTGVLLRLLLDEDAGWMFEIDNAADVVSYYECRWLDWSSSEERIKFVDDELNFALLEDLARRHGVQGNVAEQLERIVHPHIIRGVDEEGEDPDVEFDEFADWPNDETDNVAHAFAKLLKLPRFMGGWRFVKRHGVQTWLGDGAVEFRP